MTANRRIRKNKNKRSTTDVDPYTERYRKASDGAKAARAAARSRSGEDRRVAGEASGEGFVGEARAHEGREPSQAAIVIGEGARIRSVSLVKPEDSILGYTIEVGGESHFTPAEGHLEVGLDPDKDYHIVDAVGYRPSHGLAPELLEREVERQLGYPDREEALREEASLDAAPVVERGSSLASGQLDTPEGTLAAIQGEASRARLNYQHTHRVFFEAEVHGLPQHVGTDICACDIRQDHWVEIGAN